MNLNSSKYIKEILIFSDSLLKDRRMVHRLTTSDNDWNNKW